MKFGDPGGEGIIQDVRFLTETNANSYSAKDIARNANRWAYKAVTWIFDSADFQFDDRTLTDRAIGKFDLVDDQDWYTQPTDILKWDELQIKDSNGDLYKVWPIDQSDEVDVALSSVYDTKGKPRFYDLYGEEFRLLPAADSNDVTLTNGGRIYYRREINLFEPSNTGQSPGFVAPFHRIPSLGAAYDWLISNGQQNRAQTVRSELEQLKQELQDFYADFDEDTKDQITPQHANRSTRQQWQ